MFQPAMIVATLGSLGGFWMSAGVDTITAKIMIVLALCLVAAIVITGRLENPPKDAASHI